MDLTIIWILILAWAVCCLFYLLKIGRIAHSNRLSVFSPLRKYNKTLRVMVRRIYWRILLVTVLVVIAVLITFFVRSSSMNY